MIELSEKVMSEIHAHAKQEYPRESCGVVIIFKGRHRYIPCRNISSSMDNFVIAPEDWAAAEDLGEPVLVVHSHPGVPPQPSQSDLVGCEKSGLPWLIVNYPVGNSYQFEPTGYELPLMGRVFQHGVVDCYTLIRDYYRQELNIELPDFYRADDWWDKGENLYLNNFTLAGFSEVSELAPNDVILMQISSPVPNHGAIYLGDNNIIHHQYGRLSSKDVYGGWYHKITTQILRYKDFL